MTRKRLVIKSFSVHLLWMKNWTCPHITVCGVTITVSVKFNLWSACYEIKVIKELIIICYGASCSFTVPHKGCRLPLHH